MLITKNVLISHYLKTYSNWNNLYKEELRKYDTVKGFFKNLMPNNKFAEIFDKTNVTKQIKENGIENEIHLALIGATLEDAIFENNGTITINGTDVKVSELCQIFFDNYASKIIEQYNTLKQEISTIEG